MPFPSKRKLYNRLHECFSSRLKQQSHSLSLPDCWSFWFMRNISNTRKNVSSDISTLRSGLKKRGGADFFIPTSKCLI